jgi:exodeoxyribonuclease-3
MLREMRSLGLLSTYHLTTGENQGSECEATFFHHLSVEKPFHIDYCFVPSAWRAAVSSVKVGAFDDWRKLSDHCPLMADISIGA